MPLPLEVAAVSVTQKAKSLRKGTFVYRLPVIANGRGHKAEQRAVGEMKIRDESLYGADAIRRHHHHRGSEMPVSSVQGVDAPLHGRFHGPAQALRRIAKFLAPFPLVQFIGLFTGFFPFDGEPVQTLQGPQAGRTCSDPVYPFLGKGLNCIKGD